ncbi:MAG: 50S ribosomal protein L18e [archaeon]|jgi:large subunit ribosomal protein L18e
MSKKKLETRKLVASLEKTGRKTKLTLWKDVAARVNKPTRQNIVVNINKLDEMAKKNKGKILLVPGKVLSVGDLEEKATIVATTASEKAIAKISKKGKFIFLKDFVEEKTKISDIVMVK